MTQVHVQRDCPECSGNGVVQHPSWREFWRHHEDEDSIAACVREWFVERGFAEPPPEEVLCSRCRGTGALTEWVSLYGLATEMVEDERIRALLREARRG